MGGGYGCLSGSNKTKVNSHLTDISMRQERFSAMIGSKLLSNFYLTVELENLYVNFLSRTKNVKFQDHRLKFISRFPALISSIRSLSSV